LSLPGRVQARVRAVPVEELVAVVESAMETLDTYGHLCPDSEEATGAGV